MKLIITDLKLENILFVEGSYSLQAPDRRISLKRVNEELLQDTRCVDVDRIVGVSSGSDTLNVSFSSRDVVLEPQEAIMVPTNSRIKGYYNLNQ